MRDLRPFAILGHHRPDRPWAATPLYNVFIRPDDLLKVLQVPRQADRHFLRRLDSRWKPKYPRLFGRLLRYFNLVIIVGIPVCLYFWLVFEVGKAQLRIRRNLFRRLGPTDHDIFNRARFLFLFQLSVNLPVRVLCSLWWLLVHIGDPCVTKRHHRVDLLVFGISFTLFLIRLLVRVFESRLQIVVLEGDFLGKIAECPRPHDREDILLFLNSAVVRVTAADFLVAVRQVVETIAEPVILVQAVRLLVDAAHPRLMRVFEEFYPFEDVVEAPLKLRVRLAELTESAFSEHF